ncbi:MAG: DUF1801 domain-containing protein [Verrucomicrobiota bacterium]
MKAPDDIKTPEAYLAQVPEGRRAAMMELHRLIRKTVPKLKPVICHGMIGYGLRPYETKSGCKGEWPLVALANQKRHISLYLCASGPEGYLPEDAKERLGKVSVGKGCIRFTKLENLNLEVAMDLVREAAKV